VARPRQHRPAARRPGPPAAGHSPAPTGVPGFDRRHRSSVPTCDHPRPDRSRSNRRKLDARSPEQRSWKRHLAVFRLHLGRQAAARPRGARCAPRGRGAADRGARRARGGPGRMIRLPPLFARYQGVPLTSRCTRSSVAGGAAHRQRTPGLPTRGPDHAPCSALKGSTVCVAGR